MNGHEQEAEVLLKLPAWAAETYEALDRIQNLRHTPPTTPPQLTISEPTERKCRR